VCVVCGVVGAVGCGEVCGVAMPQTEGSPPVPPPSQVAGWQCEGNWAGRMEVCSVWSQCGRCSVCEVLHVRCVSRSVRVRVERAACRCVNRSVQCVCNLRQKQMRV